MIKRTKLLLIVFICLLLCGCSSKDATTFKKEYRKYNNVLRYVDISDDNPFVYKTFDEILNMKNNNETFVVYFGYPENNWCRSIIETLIESAKNNKLKTIYYVNNDELDNSITSKFTTEELSTPSIVGVVKGQIVEITDGISPSQKKAEDELSDSMKKESLEKIDKVIKAVKGKNTCNINSAC